MTDYDKEMARRMLTLPFWWFGVIAQLWADILTPPRPSRPRDGAGND